MEEASLFCWLLELMLLTVDTFFLSHLSLAVWAWRILSNPLGNAHDRFDVASSMSLCRVAEGLTLSSDNSFSLLSVSHHFSIFFFQPWAGWPSVRSGKPWQRPRYMG